MRRDVRVGNGEAAVATPRCYNDPMTEPPPPPRSAAFVFVFITVLLDMLALGMIIPVLPKLVVNFLAGDAAGAADALGVFGTAWALMQFLFSPVQGALCRAPMRA